jgi:OOP family OmpA-OmpF porin
MRRFLPSLALIAFALPALAGSDVPGSKDHPLLTRMQHMTIAAYKASPFQAHAFRDRAGRTAGIAVEGRWTQIRYRAEEGAEAPSAAAILRNHATALEKVGGSAVYQDQRYGIFKVAQGATETWVEVDTAWGRGYMLTIVEKGEMAQEVVADAAALNGDLKATGHVAVYGIYFDTSRSEVKPESKPALEEIAKLLKLEPALKLKVVGHTDMTGALEANMKLSRARAEAVVQALVSQHGVAAARLEGHGVGPLAPVATNDTEAGKAKNRRVELVKE